MMTLSTDELQQHLSTLPAWEGDTASLHRSIEFPDFQTAILAVVRVADAAEQMDHHPDIDIRWRTVTFTVSTHSAGGVTVLDIELADKISRIAASLSA
jgi:4a-hydroxytetrahydrobiopterin dehydratase